MRSPLITMSAVTGRPTEREISEYMMSLKTHGIDQIMIYPRSGCELVYLSEEWFCAVGVFLREAERLDMGVWLYDDFNWPSGDAGGQISQSESLRLRSITVTGEGMGNIRSASSNHGSLFGETYFADLLSDEAVERFIRCTHEQYYRRFGTYFGRVICGIYTDEPAVGYSCTSDSIPYYDGIAQDYTVLCGRDFWKDLYAEHASFTAYAMKAVGARFRRCYIDRLSDWCREHGIVMTGHLMSDDSPAGATRQNGDYLKALSGMMMPGVDEIFTDFHIPYLLPLLGNVAYARGEQGTMAELFALGPCDMSYAKKRCMLFLCAAFGVDHYFVAISHMDMRGNASIKDYYQSFSDDQPDFGGMHLLSAEAARAAVLAQRLYRADVYVRYPTAVCARHMTDMPDMAPFYELIQALSRHQIQWKYADSMDTPDDAPIIEFTDQMESVLQDTVTSDAARICALLDTPTRVTDMNGELPQGLFVRVFDDGHVLVVELDGMGGDYRIDGKAVHIEAYGVYQSDDGEAICGQRQALTASFQLTYQSPNQIRAMFINGQTLSTVWCAQDTKVRFAVRNGVGAALDGEPVRCHVGQDVLCRGMRSLYGVSDVVTLKKGTHTLGSEQDIKYLPSVLMLGDFAAEIVSDDICGVKLLPRKRQAEVGEHFSDFGEVVFQADVCVPADARALELVGTKLYTRVLLNGEPLGERIYAPYIFSVDEKFCGQTAELTVVQASSQAPIFGDVGYFDQMSEDVKWRGTPAPEQTLFGFSAINWIV